MATASAPSLPLSPPPPSPPRKRLSKVLTAGRRRSSDVQSESGATGKRASVESIGLTNSTIVQPQRSPSRDGSTKSGNSAGIRKLIPGHAKRERKKVREEELSKITQEEAARGRQPAPDADEQRPDYSNRSHSSLVTVDSDVESPPALTSRDSHSGYLTTTSPFITTTTVDRTYNVSDSNPSVEQFPSIIEPPIVSSQNPSPRSGAVHEVPTLPVLSGLTDKAGSLKPASDPSRARGKSPARRFKDVFARSGKSPRVSPERRDTEPLSTDSSEPKKLSSGFSERRLSNNPEARGPSPLRTQTIPSVPVPKPAMPVLQTDVPTPKTPPGSVFSSPITTVTPPTPTDSDSRSKIPESPTFDSIMGKQSGEPVSDGTQSGGNSLSHRRQRSVPGAMHQKSKLSMSMAAPLTPTIEEIQTPPATGGPPGSRNVSAGGSFFSSWVSAAQNAATSITSLTNQNRSRAGTGLSDQTKSTLVEEPVKQNPGDTQNEEDETPKKELAVSTLGSGDLDLSHLGIETLSDRPGTSPSRSQFTTNGKTDHTAARMEDLLAKRAVSEAYEKPGTPGDATPIAELPDPVGSVKPVSTFDATSGALTPPNGSIFEGETGGVKRSNSVRSKLHNRRSRGSSVTTAQSTIGAMIGASTATLTNPAAGPKLSGFAIAPKPRNRAFHQQFRSVPEDDFLIEDYSSALQKEILLAGRLYISEGHICFSSNILGWVTTLIISFEEVVSIEKEYTAIVIPNAIAVQTLHARHTFRSLLSREATYDLMIGIWRVSHPDSFQKSMNGQKLAAGITSSDNVTNTGEEADAVASEDDSDEGSGSDDDDDGSEASVGSSSGVASGEIIESKSLSRKPSGVHANGPGLSIAASAAPAAGDATSTVAPVVGAVDGAQDFPGPATHTSTECTDASTHYDKIIKDEIIPAPLGKIYSLLYGPQSTVFVRKFLVDGVSKVLDLQLEDDKKGLDNETKSRKYQYVKPLGGSIGPKQTTCITTETLDFFDLEKAVSVSCTTLTPDVPSGSAFSTKTRYCLTWAPGNATRFQMNMTIEWTAKSWLKGPIEKGALDGQIQYGEDLVKTLKNALGRTRAATAGSKVLKAGKKRRKTTKKDKNGTIEAETKKEDNWGPLEVLRPVLGPVVAPLQPFVRMNVVVSVLAFMVLWMWVRGPSSTSSSALSRSGRIDHMLLYEDLWRREESDLWEWLQDRTGVDGAIVQDRLANEAAMNKDNRQKLKQRQKLLKSKDMQTRIREEKRSMKEMEEVVRVTQERLDSLQRALERQKTD